MAIPSPTIHASAVLVGARAVLIRGPAGAGKSRLALDLLQAGESGLLPFVRLVADDRTRLEAAHGRLLARPAPELAGLLEVRGLGIRRLPYEPVAVVSLILDLAVAKAGRMPASAEAVCEGVVLPRLDVGCGVDPLPLVVAALKTAAAF
jgi:hypothetical protein